MIELHGWLTIKETYKAVFEEEDQIDLVIEEIQEEINHLYWFKPEIKAQNGEWYINVSLFANRSNPQVLEVFELFKKIGRIAVGSYGLIYLYDDEDRDGKQNQFQVFSLARGLLKENSDPFLSSIVPTIEDKNELN